MALGWGIVGIGKIADNAVAPGITKLDGASLVACVSRDQGRADAFAEKHGGRGLTSYEEMLADPQVDVVYIGTPNAQHPEQAVAAARAGKHVFCDKPLAMSVEASQEVIDAAAQAGVRLGVNFQTRHHEAILRAREALQAGAIGKVLIVQIEVSPGILPLGSWRADRTLAGLGAINNIGVHAYDLLRHMLDTEITEVVALTDVDASTELETTAVALLRLADGTLAYVNANQTVPNFQADLAIYGTEGRIVGRGVTRPFIADGELRILSGGEETTTPSSTTDAFARAVAAFQHAVVSDEQPNPSGIDGLRSVQVADALALSARERRVVALDA